MSYQGYWTAEQLSGVEPNENHHGQSHRTGELQSGGLYDCCPEVEFNQINQAVSDTLRFWWAQTFGRWYSEYSRETPSASICLVMLIISLDQMSLNRLQQQKKQNNKQFGSRFMRQCRGVIKINAWLAQFKKKKKKIADFSLLMKDWISWRNEKLFYIIKCH